MRIGKRAVLVAVTGVALASAAGSAAAGTPKWTDFGRGTGVQAVSYNQGPTTYLSKSGSGIVEQWVSPTVVPPYGAYYLYKPLTSGTITTPFKRSCDSLGRTAAFDWTYNSASYSPAGVLTPYFPFDGEKYYVCVYDLYDHAQADVTYHAVSATPDRHVTYSVHEASPFGPAGGTFNYSDSDGVSYTVNVDAVDISGNTVVFSGVYGPGLWLIVKDVVTASGIEQYGDVVNFDPSASLTSYVFSLQAFDVAGSVSIYTR